MTFASLGPFESLHRELFGSHTLLESTIVQALSRSIGCSDGRRQSTKRVGSGNGANGSMDEEYHTMSQNVITLYDVPSIAPQPWAPNIWRIRFLLNYKRLPHRTVWVEFSDVEATLRSINAPPTSMRSDNRPVYTLPAIVDPLRSRSHPVVLSNVQTIAEYLETAYPARAVFPEGIACPPNIIRPSYPRCFRQAAITDTRPIESSKAPGEEPDLFPRSCILTVDWVAARTGLESCQGAI
ncbi:hypothetical protein QCA50_007148 [Cerrena zonata]|uniref:GST N-terminal domain-containing protein n=1 Tax=Cerrena zonata TaxID=2478898 RepID=A0AAW0GCU7_9APHY